jgi:hypothetical protein
VASPFETLRKGAAPQDEVLGQERNRISIEGKTPALVLHHNRGSD